MCSTGGDLILGEQYVPYGSPPQKENKVGGMG